VLVWIIVAAAVVTAGFVRVGVSLRHAPGETRVAVRFGLFRVTVLPAKPRKTKKRKPKARRREPLWRGLKFSELELKPLIPLATGLSKKMARGIRFDRIEVECALGGKDDPAETAIAYGAWMTCIGTLLPVLNQALRIKRFRVAMIPDFTRKKGETRARLEVSMSIGRGFGVGLYILVKGGGLIMQIRNPKRKAV